EKGWWRGRWWWATIQGNVLTRAAELQSQLDKVEKALKDLDVEAQRALAEQEQARALYQAERQRLVEAEVGRRQADIDDQEAAVRQERRLVQDKWHAACQELSSESDRPPEADSAAVATARPGLAPKLRRA